jgi:hypothetical protein
MMDTSALRTGWAPAAEMVEHAEARSAAPVGTCTPARRSAPNEVNAASDAN